MRCTFISSCIYSVKNSLSLLELDHFISKLIVIRMKGKLTLIWCLNFRYEEY